MKELSSDLLFYTDRCLCTVALARETVDDISMRCGDGFHRNRSSLSRPGNG